MVEDSLLHPAAPFLAWLMAATSKGFRPPKPLVLAFLCVAYEIALCPVRDTTESFRLRRSRDGKAVDFQDDGIAAPHPRDLVAAAERVGRPSGSEGDGHSPAARPGRRRAWDGAGDAAVACLRRALLLRVAYGGMPCDQALLKGVCLSWGERCGHLEAEDGQPGTGARPPQQQGTRRRPGAIEGPGARAMTYVHTSAIAALGGHRWASFLASSYAGCGMPPPLRLRLEACLVDDSIPSTDAAGEPAGGVDSGEPLLRDVGTSPVTQGATRALVWHRADVAGDMEGMGRQRSDGHLRPPLEKIVRETDAILSGVDYHCSNVLEEVLQEQVVTERLRQALGEGFGSDGIRGEGRARTGVCGGRELREAAKGAMWVCSSGVNARRLALKFVPPPGEDGAPQPAREALCLLASPGDGSGSGSDLDKRVWEVLRDRVEEWTQRFVRRRLSPSRSLA